MKRKTKDVARLLPELRLCQPIITAQLEDKNDAMVVKEITGTVNIRGLKPRSRHIPTSCPACRPSLRWEVQNKINNPMTPPLLYQGIVGDFFVFK